MKWNNFDRDRTFGDMFVACPSCGEPIGKMVGTSDPHAIDCELREFGLAETRELKRIYDGEISASEVTA